MKEFNIDKLFEWRGNGVQYIGIHHYVPELSVNDEISEFIVIPFLALEDAQAFLSDKLNTLNIEEKNAAFFYIDSSEAFEIATGMGTSKFYVLTTTTSPTPNTSSIK